MSSARRGAAAHLGAALPGWIVARVIVLVAAAAGRFVLHRGFRPPITVIRAHTGLMSWDADWYRRIATVGYAGLPHSALRFFPLYPLLGRAVAPLLGGHTDWALLLIANGLALVLGALVHRLALAEGAGDDLARRAAWLTALAPPAFVLVMGYSEPLSLCLAVSCFLALRGKRWGWAAAAGFLAGLARPVGVLLVVPAAIEVWRARSGTGLAAKLAAVAAPAAGAGVFLAWVGIRFGDLLLPLRDQQQEGLRGKTVNPLLTVIRAGRGLATGDLGRQAHFITVFVAIALVVVVLLQWPASYGAYTAATVLAAMAADHLGSLERYVYGAFPVVLALALIADGEQRERIVFTLSAAAMSAS